MTDAAPVYQIVQRYHVNQWNDDLQAVVPGWIVKARWIATGAILPVFVSDDVYTAENVDRLVRSAGARDEAVHQLGG